MRNNHVQFKINKIFLLLFIIKLIAVAGCKKELLTNEKLDPVLLQKNLAYKKGPQIISLNLTQFKSKVNQAALGVLKKQFNVADAPQKLMSINLPETYSGFKLITDSIKMITNGSSISYVFPVKLSSARAISFQNLTIVESPNGTSAFVTTYTPTPVWTKTWKEGHYDKFDGGIVVTPLDLGNGNVTIAPSINNVFKNEKISSLTPMPKTALADQNCTEYTFYYTEAYKCGSGNHWPGDPNCTLTGEGAAGYANIASTMTICTGNGGGGGGTTPTPDPEFDPCPKTPPAVEFRGLRGERLAVAEGTTLCDLEPLPPLIILKEIINKITDPCLKTTVQEAIDSNKDIKGFLSGVIDKYSGKNNGIKINLYNGSITKPANTVPSFNGNTFTADITFQNDYYNDLSKEAVVAALMHEVVHAYLFQTSSNYRTLSQAEQHNFLFTNFVQDISIYLIDKYNMPNEDAYGLAWSGMGDIYNNADNNTTFITVPAKPATENTPAIPAQTMTKNQIANAMAPYKYTGAGSKGTPNCPN